MNFLLANGGGFHPALVHLPIGFCLALALIEAGVLARRLPPSRDVVRVLSGALAATALLSVASGLVLGRSGDYDEAMLTGHRNAALFFAVGCAMLSVFAYGGDVRAYRPTLAVVTALAFVTGHAGGELTHGEGFLFQDKGAASRRAESRPAADAPGAAETFDNAVRPVFAQYCAACHGDQKKKGGLSLATRATIEKGGENGPLFVARAPDKSELVQRLRLPADEEAHMPPAAKPQPTAAEIDVLVRWIAAGAPFEAAFGSAAAPIARGGLPNDLPAVGVVATLDPAAPPADPKAVAALAATLINVAPVASGSTLLEIDVSAIAGKVDDGFFDRTIAPLGKNIAALRLAASPIGDRSLATIGAMPHLGSLDVRRTRVTAQGITSLGRPAHLKKLVLAETAVDDTAIDALIALPALQELYLWKSAVTPAGLSRLSTARPTLKIDAAVPRESAGLETEGPVSFGKKKPAAAPNPDPKSTPPAASGANGTPKPDPAAPTSAPVAKPVNTVCPISGKPVDPQYTFTFEGRLIAFCCPKCCAAFAADPLKYASALR